MPYSLATKDGRMKAVFETSFKGREASAMIGSSVCPGACPRPRMRRRDRGSVLQSRLAQADAHRLDVELLLEPVKNFVADRALVSKRDQGSPLGRQGLVA
jgi:hypothetical protein